MASGLAPIHTSKVPEPRGHYSQAIVHQGVIYVSGQVPKDFRGTIASSIEEQTAVVLKNLGELLAAANSAVNRVLKITVYLSDLRAWEKMNEVYARFFGEHQPARTVLPMPGLPRGYLIEIDAIAAVADSVPRGESLGRAP